MHDTGISNEIKVLKEKKDEFDGNVKQYFNYFLLSLAVSLLLSLINKYLWEMPELLKLLSISTYIIPAGMLFMFIVALYFDIYWSQRISEKREFELINNKSSDLNEDNRGSNKKDEKQIPTDEVWEIVKFEAIKYGPTCIGTQRNKTNVNPDFVKLVYKKHNSKLIAYALNDVDMKNPIPMTEITFQRRLNNKDLRYKWIPSEKECKKNLSHAQIFWKTIKKLKQRK